MLARQRSRIKRARAQAPSKYRYSSAIQSLTVERGEMFALQRRHLVELLCSLHNEPRQRSQAIRGISENVESSQTGVEVFLCLGPARLEPHQLRIRVLTFARILLRSLPHLLGR